MACFRAFGGLRSKSRSLERPTEAPAPATATTAKASLPVGPDDEAPRLESFSSATPLNVGVDSSQVSPEVFHHHHPSKHELPDFAAQDENDKETKIDLEAAIRAVNVALTGLEIGGKRQGTPTPSRPETAPAPQRSRPGFPPKAVLPRAIRRFAKFVTPQQQPLAESLTMQQQQGQQQQQSGMQLPYQQQRPNSTDFLMSSGELLNAQLNGYLPNGLDMRSNYSESDMHNAMWGSQSNDGWNLHQLQSLINQQQGLAAQNGVSRHMSADFANNPQLQKYAMDNAIAEFLMNSSDSWSSKIEVPKQGSVRGDSFSSKIEFPVTCDSFTSKMSGASVREDSFTSQHQQQQQSLWNRGVEQQRPMSDALMDTAFSIPESIVQELECMAEGDVASSKQPLELKPGVQLDPHTKSEQEILLAITETLKSALEGTLCQDDLAADLNFLTIAVRRHLMDYQTFSSDTAEKFLLVGSTLPVVCRTAMFGNPVLSLLKRFMDIISSGHPMLSNAAICVAPAAHVDLQKQSEARHLLARIHRSLTGGQDSDGVAQPPGFTSYDSSEAHSSEAMPLKNAASESVLREYSNSSPDTSDSIAHNDNVLSSA